MNYEVDCILRASELLSSSYCRIGPQSIYVTSKIQNGAAALQISGIFKIRKYCITIVLVKNVIT